MQNKKTRKPSSFSAPSSETNSVSSGSSDELKLSSHKETNQIAEIKEVSKYHAVDINSVNDYFDEEYFNEKYILYIQG